MEEPHSMNSPRRVLSFSRKGKDALFVPNPDNNRTSRIAVSGQHGPKPSEVYGFVGAISTVVATVIFLIWAYLPEHWLHSVGIFYYPSRYWALVVPTYTMVTIALAILFYIGLNFMATPSPTSLTTIFDDYSRDALNSSDLSMEDDERPIEPISDLGIDLINDLMFKDWKS
ncbi:phosphatidylinositol N-acetylglucosaminyltransferase subunit P [Impatiens glandulifera]|uniref:phosphatidylinositol N-acetylglucosaminyltransferase subunit P n=1 Tax=Impatiens glandulifera TaxID=253017 RepID=UPI001FB1A0B5|nr:phosphatidylinositol N-acetylglucosaminyltransferase subunit P [Impatiens glandulifera]XP_047336547.1 phosphatidylinositol N-acetylglucosaminyltransferase subunit P [Impatiens glandulifera]